MHTGPRKYRDQTEDADGNKLTWPGTLHGFPVRGPAPHLKQGERDNLPVTVDFKSRLFRLYDDTDHKEFDDIMDRVANGLYRVTNRVNRWSDDHCGMIVWLEWLQFYGDTSLLAEKINA